MTKKHKELLARFEARSKELNDFLDAKGDSITHEDLTEAHKIRDDLKSIQAEIEIEKQAGELRGEATSFRAYLDDPNPGTPGFSTRVIGNQRAGSTTLERPSPNSARRRALRVLEERGAGILNEASGYGKNAGKVICDPEYARAFGLYLTRGEKAAMRHFRNLEDGLDPQGGFLAPAQLIARLIERKPTPTRVSGLVDSITCTRDAISLPRVNYTGNATDDPSANIYNTGFRATLTDENPTSDTQAMVTDTNIFGAVRVSVYTWLIEGILTNNQIEDAMFSPLEWMVSKFGLTVDLLKDNVIINGTGASQPVGLLANPGGTDTQSYPPTVSSGAPAAPRRIEPPVARLDRERE